ncbi:hypothetical protein ACX0G9_26845 [Flavitalea flava]
MYFLAFEAVLKNTDETYLDCNPDKTDGIHARKAIEFEFTKLVLLGNADGHPYQVYELGKIAKDGTMPEKRISSNFLTVPLKNASKQAAPYYYPKRPAPLMNLGQAASGVKWGIVRHTDWAKNLPRFFSEITGSTFFTDLAVFVVRDMPIPDSHAKNCIDALTILLGKKFSAELSEFWIDKIKKEHILARHLASPFCNAYEPLVDKIRVSSGLSPKTELEELKNRIAYFEGLLQANGIRY